MVGGSLAWHELGRHGQQQPMMAGVAGVAGVAGRELGAWHGLDQDGSFSRLGCHSQFL